MSKKKGDEGGVGLADPNLKGVDESEVMTLAHAIKSLMAEKDEEEERPDPDSVVEPYVETYWKVMFHQKSNPMEPNDVIIGVNGEVLQMQRGKEVVVPKRYLEASEHAYYESFSQMPGEERKTTARVSVYTYTILEQSTAKEYFAQKREGDRIAREALKIKEAGLG
jgi:hypothetical protein